MKTVMILLVLVLAFLVAATRYLAYRVESRFPPTGTFVEVDGQKLHFTDHAAGPDADLLPVVFIHGASGNLRDLEAPLLDRLKGRGRLIFLDRPGHGYSERGRRDDVHLPSGQAELISGLLGKLSIERAVIAGHSYGGAVAAAFAVNHPEQTAGLVFLAPATHPWPGGGVTWYYDVAEMPVFGRLFTETLAVPGGQLRYEDGVKGVFKPEKLPESYEERSATKLVLRPNVFRFNARDVSSLYDFVVGFSPRYKEITVPASILSGDADDVVLANIHSTGLETDIEGAKLVWLEGVGHAPAWTATDRVISEIERVSRAASAE